MAIARPSSLQTILKAQLNSSSEEDKKKAYDSIFEIAGHFSWEKQKEFMMALFPSRNYKSLDKAGVKNEFKKIQKEVEQRHPSLLSTDDLLKHFKALVASPPEYPGDIYDAPVVEVTSTETDPAKMTKLSLRHDLEKNTYIQYCSYLSPKSGGANKPGPLGANYLRIYMTKDGRVHGQKLFIKQATDDNKPNQRENMAEVIAGRIMNSVAGDHIASTFHTFPKPGDHDPANVYVVSIFYDSYTDLHTAAHEKMQPGKTFPTRGKGAGGGQNINSKPKIIPKFVPKLGGSNVGGTPDYQPGLEKIISEDYITRGHGLVDGVNNLVGNNQGHSENKGIIASKRKKVIGGIDFGGAFRRSYTTKKGLKPKTKETGSKFSRVVHPEQIEGRKYNVAYFLATPESIRYSKDFIDEIDEIVNVDKNIIIKSVDEAIDYAVKYYGVKEFLTHFASELDKTNQELNLLSGTDEEKVAATKIFLKNTLLARQLSLKEFALESKLKHIARGGTDFNLSDLMQDHPIYFSYKNQLDHSVFTPLENILLTHLRNASNLESITRDFYNKINSVLDLKDATTLISKEDLDKLAATTHFLKYVLQSGHYDFDNQDDQEILIQACDEAYQNLKLVLQKIPENNSSRKKLLEEMSPPPVTASVSSVAKKTVEFQLPKTIRPRSATVPAAVSSTSSMSKNMESQRIMQDLAHRGLVTQTVSENKPFTTNKALQKRAHDIGAQTVYKLGDRSPAKGAIYVDKKTALNYEIIPIKPPDDDTIEAKLENVHAIIGTFISNRGYGAPLYIYNAQNDELTKFYLAVCDANGIKAYDENGVLLDKSHFPRDSAIVVPAHLQYLDPHKVKADAQQKDEIAIARRWMQAVESTFQQKDILFISSQLDKKQLLALQNQLVIDKKRCDNFINHFSKNGITELVVELKQVSMRLEQAIKNVNEKLASMPSGLKIMSGPKVSP